MIRRSVYLLVLTSGLLLLSLAPVYLFAYTSLQWMSPSSAGGCLLAFGTIIVVLAQMFANGGAFDRLHQACGFPPIFVILFDVGASLILCYAMMYTVYGVTNGTDVIKDMQTSLYFSLVTWTTLGYGDLQPTPQVRMVAASEALCGYIFMAYAIGLALREPKKVQPKRNTNLSTAGAK